MKPLIAFDFVTAGESQPLKPQI
eukprot:gene26764-biopygen17314